MNNLNSICVFCGSNAGTKPRFGEQAVALGKLIAEEGMTLVYGGGSIGLMGILARTTAENGGSVVSIIPESLRSVEAVGESVGELIVCDTMLERKNIMAEKSDGFIAMPGGYGTLDEIFEMVTWTQLGIHTKPMGFLNVDDFFDPLLNAIDQIVAQGFIRSTHRELIVDDPDPAALITKIRNQPLPKSIIEWK